MSDGITIDVKGVDQVAGKLVAAGAKAGFVAAGLVRMYGVMAQSQVRAFASGRPGPNIVTGDYNRSISLEVGMNGADYQARIYSNRPQSARLELGFAGTDSLGRTYNQGPLPHFAPAAKKIEPLFVAAVTAAIGAVLE